MTVNILRDWTYENLHPLEHLARQFIDETDLPVTFCEETFSRYIWSIMKSDESDVIMAWEDDELVGGAIVAAERDFCEEPFGYIVKFYIHPHHRKTKAPVKLCKAVEDWFEMKNVVFSFATSTAMIGKEKNYTNLMGRFGYSDAGPTLMKSHGEF